MAIRKRLRWLECRRELWLHLWETTPWQSMLIFMKEFFWINEKPLCSLSEVFLIIWTLFSLHATLYQKFIKTFFFFALLLLVLCFPIDIPLFMFASTSADFQKGHQSFAETEWEITPQEITEKTKTVGMQTNCSSLARTDQTFMSGCRSELMRFTIQLNRRPYNALDMASRTSAALSTVLERMMVSPLVTTHWEVSASWSSSGPMLRRDAAEKKARQSISFTVKRLLHLITIL